MSSTSPALRDGVHSSTASRKFKGCSNIREYEVLQKLGEGTFGEVHKARARITGAAVALKKILMHNEKDGFPITALREIKLLKELSHPNVLRLEEMAVERKGEGRKKAILYMVTPYMDHDLSGLLENPAVHFTEPQIKCYMMQILEGLRYLHDSHILHRDMKAANLLINNQGILQIADFGLARHYDEPVPQPGRGGGEAKRDYTSLVVTRWYRPPELLLQLRRYTTAIDMWGVGCVFGEMFKRKPILSGTSDLNQALIIFDLVGSPTEENMPGWGQLPGCEGVKSFASRTGNLASVFKEYVSLLMSPFHHCANIANTDNPHKPLLYLANYSSLTGAKESMRLTHCNIRTLRRIPSLHGQKRYRDSKNLTSSTDGSFETAKHFPLHQQVELWEWAKMGSGTVQVLQTVTAT